MGNFRRTVRGSMLGGALLAAVAVLFTITAQAAPYQTQASLLYSTVDADPSVDITMIGAAATYYFAPISVKGPLAEAEFIAKASGVSAGLLSVDVDYSGRNADGNGYYLGIRYVVPGQDIVLGLVTSSIEQSGGGIDADSTSTTFNIGKYLNDKALVEFYYNTGTQSITGLPDNDTSAILLSGKLLAEMEGKTVNFEASFSQDKYDAGSGDDGTNITLSISGDYYIDDTLGIGAGFATNSGDDSGSEGSTLSFNITKFVTDAISASVDYEVFSADDSDNDSTSLSLVVSGRF